MIKTISMLSLVLVFLSGCTVRHGDFTIVSTKNMEISRVDLKRVDFQRNVEGEDGRYWFLFIPLGSTPVLEEACDNCLEKGQGDFMTSGVIYHTSWHFLLFGYDGWSVKGDVGNSLSDGAADLKNRSLD